MLCVYFEVQTDTERKAPWKGHPFMKDAKEELKEGQKFYLQPKENIVH